MMWLKSCPRCRTGDVVLGKDVYGRYIQCLQCGFMKELYEHTRIAAVAGQRSGEPELSASVQHYRS